MTNRTKRGLQYALLSPLVGAGCVVGGIVLGVSAPYWWTLVGLKRGEAEDNAAALAEALNAQITKGGKKTPKTQAVSESDVKKLIKIAQAVASGELEPKQAISQFKRAAGKKKALRSLAVGFEQRLAGAGA